MKRVYYAQNSMFAGHVEAVLKQHGIEAFVRNSFLGGAAGEVPPHEALPQVWVLDDDDYARALQIIADVLEAPPGKDWRCPRCGEQIEGQFAACWNCGEPAP